MIDMCTRITVRAVRRASNTKTTIYTSTQQCAAGGVTTTVGMPNVTPPPNSVALLKRQFAIYESDAIVDWNFNPAPTIVEEIPFLAEQGIASFKIFMVVDTGRNYPAHARDRCA